MKVSCALVLLVGLASMSSVAAELAAEQWYGAITPGTVLRHNHYYRLTGDATVDASAIPSLSALRVEQCAAAVIEIPQGVTLTVKGGPGYGRLPAGAGIEVP